MISNSNFVLINLPPLNGQPLISIWNGRAGTMEPKNRKKHDALILKVLNYINIKLRGI